MEVLVSDIGQKREKAKKREKKMWLSPGTKDEKSSVPVVRAPHPGHRRALDPGPFPTRFCHDTGAQVLPLEVEFGVNDLPAMNLFTQGTLPIFTSENSCEPAPTVQTVKCDINAGITSSFRKKEVAWGIR